MNKPLIALSFLLAFATGYLWLWPIEAVDTSPMTPNANGGTNNTRFSEPDLRQIEEARFFLNTKALAFGLPPSATATASKPPTMEAKTSTSPSLIKDATAEVERPVFRWRLAGILEGSGGARAVFVGGTQSQILLRGQVLDGWTLGQISSGAVKLSNGRFSRTLTLFDKDNSPEDGYAFGANANTFNFGTGSQQSAPQSMQDFGPVRRGVAWENSTIKANTKQGGPVSLWRPNYQAEAEVDVDVTADPQPQAQPRN